MANQETKENINFQAFQIVIIEDDEGLGKLIQVTLQREGFKTVLCETGEKALTKVQGDSNEILLVDYNLPDMTGQELVKKLIKKHSVTPNFFTLTGYGNEKVAAEMMRLGSHDYIVKEKRFLDVLSAVVKRVCEDVENRNNLVKTKEQLREKLELLKETGEMASVGGWEIDLQTNKVFWTDTTKKIHEVAKDYVPTLEEAIDFFPGESKKQIQKAVTQAIQKGIEYELELQFITAKGNQRWVHTIGKPIIKDGKCIALRGTFQDITRRKNAENELTINNAVLKRTEGIAHVGSWEWDVKTDTVTWSEELFRIFKLDPKKGAPSYADHPKIYTPESMKKLDEGVKKCIETGESYQLDLEIVRGDGTTAFCTARGLAKKDESGKVIRLFGSFQDITERKKTEEILKFANEEMAASEQQLRAANQQLTANEQQLKTTNEHLKAEEKKSRKLASKLGERLKEMNCLYSIALIIETPGISLDEILKRSVKTIPAGWQSPDKTSARIVLNDKEYKTDDFRESDNKISETLRVNGEKTGMTEVFLHNDSDKKKPLAFLKEEKRLLYLIAERLGKVISRIYSSEKLEETTRLLNETENTAKIGGWEFDPKTLKQYWTPETFRILEIDTTKEEPDVPKGLGFIDTKFRPEAEKAIQNAIEKGEPYNYEWIITTAKGKKKWVNAVAKPFMENGIVKKVRGSFQDISERKEAEKNLKAAYQQLAASEQQLQAGNQQLKAINQQLTSSEQQLRAANQQLAANEQQLRAANQQLIAHQQELTKSKETAESYLNVAAEIIISLDVNGNITLLNESGHQLLGYRNGELIGKNWFNTCLPQNNIKEIKGVFTQLMAGKSEGVENYESDLVTQSGEVRTIVWHNSILKNEKGDIIGILTSGEDITERKKAQELLAASERKYRSIMDNSSSSIFIKDVNGKYLYINRKFEEMHKISNDEAQSLTDNDIFPNELAEQFRENDQEIINTGKPANFEEEVSWKGEMKTVLSNKFPLRDGEGEIYAVCGIAADITEQKKAEKELKNSEIKFRNIAENIPGLVLRYKLNNDGTDELLYLGKSVETLFEIPYKEAIKKVKLMWDRIHPDDLKDYIDSIKKSAAKLSFWNTEHRIIMPDGRVKWIQARGVPVKDKDGNIIWDTLQIDITEQKKAEKELIKAKEKVEENAKEFRSLAESMPQIVWSTLPNGMNIYFNQQWVDYTGLTLEESYGEGWNKPFHPDDKKRAWDAWQNAVNNNVAYSIECRLRRKDGEYFWWLIRGVPVLDEKGNIVKWFGTCTDIQNIKDSEKELIKAKEKAEKADMLKSAFLANMSHEIRTPMNGILGFTDLLQTPDLSGEQRQKFISIIQKSGNRMLETVNALIDISKIETGQVEVSMESVDINSVLMLHYSFFKPEANKKGLDLTVESQLDNKYSIINTDRQKLDSIFTNLIKNAIKYTDKGFIKTGLERIDGYLRFYIKDSGIGVPENRRKAIFNRFEQADIKDTRAFQGSGLGLAIIKAYVEMLGGKIWAESVEGKGSTFYFTLPFEEQATEKKQEMKEIKSAPAKQMSPNRKLNILIVEDDITTVSFLKVVLSERNATLLFAENGQDAVEMVKNHPEIDSIIMDIKLPVMDGYEATRKIREFNKEVKIIAQTAYALEGDREKAIEAGCDDYISKPINKNLLLKMLDQKKE